MFTGIETIIKSAHVSGEAFFLSNTSSGLVVNRALLEPQAEKEITKAFIKKLQEEVIIPNAGKASTPLVSTLLERDRQVFEYDYPAIGHLPAEFKEIEKVLTYGVNSSPAPFNFSTQNLSSVKGLIYHISDGAGVSVILYQHKYPVALHRKTRSSFCSFNGRTLDKVKNDAIDISDTIDVFYFSNKFYTLNVGLLERLYGLQQVIDNLAHSATPMILALNIINVSNMQAPSDVFKDMYKDRAFMRRLAMISKGNIVKSGVRISQIKQVMSQFPVFNRSIDLSGGLVNLNTKDQKRYFIRLLNNEASFAALDNTPFLAVEKDSAA